jgi:nitrogen fixation NifU-like protein
VNRAEIIDFLVEHARSPSNRGRLADADVVVSGGNPNCADVVTIFLKVDRENDRVAAASFEGEGCTISQAAASVLTEMVKGSPLVDIEAMDYNGMMDVLGREVVRSRPTCATLALSTLKAAVQKYRRHGATDGSEGGPTEDAPSSGSVAPGPAAYPTG